MVIVLHTTASPRVSVVLPARNEARTVGTIVDAVARRGFADEILVVDDGSSDATAARASAAGARVIASAGGPGKGTAMWTGVGAAAGDVIVFCDADLEDFDAAILETLAGTLVAAGDALVMVKADYEREGTGGRVNELVARPVLELLHPHASALAQPLGGEYAAWRWALEQVPFVRGYGVEMGLLLDLAARFGAAAVAETHVGTRRHRNRTLKELAPQARDVLAVALHRAGVPGVSVDELPPLASVATRVDRRSA